jgi:GDP-4-dehydro-6-deoxy-D-mannose reductase
MTGPTAARGQAGADPSRRPGAASTSGSGRSRDSSGTLIVTGGSGFAGRHLRDLLSADGSTPLAPGHGDLELRDRAAVTAAVREAEPRAVFHLAAFSSPRLSLVRPDEALLPNLEMTLNVLEAVRAAAPAATVVLVGSGQVYGDPAHLPVDEDSPLRPGNPYAVSKAASDLLGRQYSESFGLRVVRLRPFNHAGPGQSDEYVLSGLARQVAEAELDGASEAVLKAGDTSVRRDFTDVRDVVRAYALAVDAEPGAYNVCSGSSTSIAEVIELLADIAEVPVHPELDPARLRSHDARDMRGSHERLTAATGWQPQIPLAETARATLDWWRERLRAAG